jgi:hypothetical protein
MSGRSITLLKVASSAGLGAVIGKGLKKYVGAGGRLGGAAAERIGLHRGLGEVAGMGAAIAAPVAVARQTKSGRKAERLAGKTMGVVGRTGERLLTPGDWGMLPGETY